MDVPIDSTIILVDIDDMARDEISRLLDRIREQNPKVVGLDVIFEKEKDANSDSMLVRSLANIEQVVLAGSPKDFDEKLGSYLHLAGSHPKFSKYGKTGSTKLIGDGKAGGYFKTIRAFNPQEKIRNVFDSHFAVQIASIYDQNISFQFLQRENEMELIHFRRTIDNYIKLSASDIHSLSNLSFINDRIVLLGFLGLDGREKDFESTYFTPMNKRIAGRSYPDTRSTVIFANIISMILEESAIENWDIFSYIISLFILYLFVYFLNKQIYQKYAGNYPLISKFTTFLLISFLIWLPLMIFKFTLIKIDLRWAIFYLVFAPDGFEILEVRFFSRLKSIQLSK